MTDFDFDGVAELLVREHAERTSDEDARDAIALQLRRAYEAGVAAGVDQRELVRRAQRETDEEPF